MQRDEEDKDKYMEKINNLNFNYPEFGVIEQEAGTKRFIICEAMDSKNECNRNNRQIGTIW
ncbi:hypothetical protein GCM10011418_21250 [Sphingobacterium alkalisoli]|nr:hypothetical protein GCM10011418_21250 [Sphingobacterium alkalisoli]